MSVFDFSRFAADEQLAYLEHMTLDRVLKSLEEGVPNALLDTPINSYSIANVRYSPGKKLVVGMTSESSVKPLGLRFLPRDKVSRKLSLAREHHPEHVFELTEVNALVWVFPGERKLKLELLTDESRLREILVEQRDVDLIGFDLVHFVPEHTYTARLGVRHRQSEQCPRTEYLKMYYDDSGARTASIMRQVRAQTNNQAIVVPDTVSYVPEYRLLLQSAVPKSDVKTLNCRSAVSAMACFHALEIDSEIDRRAGDSIIGAAAFPSAYARANALINTLYPALGEVFRAVSQRIRAVQETLPCPEVVLLHGDAHPGNLIPSVAGKIGVIDLDAVHYGAAEEDLATYFAFLLWRDVLMGESFAHRLVEYPAFIAAYNASSMTDVSIRSAWCFLAYKLLAERLSRAICRGKINECGLARLIESASMCIKQVERCRG